MTVIKILIYCLVFLFNLANCYGIDSQRNLDGVKRYLSKDEIIISENGLFVRTDNGLLAVGQLNCDDSGFRVELGNDSSSSEDLTVWKEVVTSHWENYSIEGGYFHPDPDGAIEWKHYLSHEAIDLEYLAVDTGKGVFKLAAITVETNRGILVIPQINWDQDGFYISSYFYAEFCPEHHSVCRECYKGCRRKLPL